MPYKLSGVLKSPNGQPLTGVDIQFIAQQTQSPVLQQTDHNIRLGLDGAYNVTLENNTYAVKAQINGLGPQNMGYILISSDTPAGLDLPQLLRSYSQQSTAPDYAQLIEKWLAEAKAAADTSTAQAASAKSQADRAKSEADRASQISGMDTVADAIGLAAVPFPDVWIPFNDSLRMFAGYGREVKVGDDVVARMVNFERSTTATYIDKSGVLRTAAINEPRFEKQGLLIEGQSANLFPWSQQFIGKWGRVDASLSTDAEFPNAAALDNSINGFVHTSAGELEVGSTYTISAIVKGFGEQSEIRSRFSNFSGSLIKKENFGAYTLLAWSLSIPSSAGINHAVTGISWSAGKVNGVILCALQIEKLPFASSYIPTNGTAVTRTADKVTTPRLNNDCTEWYSCADKITPIVTADTIQLVPPTGKSHLRNVKGFFSPLTEAQKKSLK